MTHPPRVLIADDEPVLLDLYETWLADLDVTVVRAGCGAEALSRCDETIDVLILDRQMPRLSGDEVLDELRDCALDPRVAFVSAVPPDIGLIDIDVDAYLTKPVTRETYVDLVQSLIDRETVSETANRYLSYLSKRAALLESESVSVLRSTPAYIAFEAELSRLAARVDADALDDPSLSRTFTDDGRDDSPGKLDPTA